MIQFALILGLAVSDPAASVKTSNDSFESLAFLIGDWVTRVDDEQLVVRVVRGENFLHFKCYEIADGAVRPRYRMALGFNPARGELRSWGFDADGARSEYVWTQQGDVWCAEREIITAQGKVQLTLKLMKGDDNSWRFESGPRGRPPSKQFTFETWKDDPPRMRGSSGVGINYRHLAQFSPLVGRWQFESKLPKGEGPEFVVWSPWNGWILDKNYLEGFVRVDGNSGVTITGWDTNDAVAKQWVFWNSGRYDAHTLERRDDCWITEFSGTDEQGEKTQGAGIYQYRQADEPPCYKLTYQESRQIANRPPKSWSIVLTRPRLASADFEKPAPGKQVVITDGIPGDVVDGYWLFLPRTHNAEKKWPVVLFLHGTSGVGGDLSVIRKLGPLGYTTQPATAPKSLKELADLVGNNFVIASPHLAKASDWIDQSDAIETIMDALIDNHGADSARIYVTGFSRGGYGTWGFASRVPSRVAAIVPISGGLLGVDDVTVLKNMAIWVVHNSGDPVVPYRWSADPVKTLEVAGGEKFLQLASAAPDGNAYLAHSHIFTIYDEKGHDAWSKTYCQPQLYRWLLHQRLHQPRQK